MRAPTRALIIAFLVSACNPEVKRVPATQTVIRIEADAVVQASLHTLRVRTAAPAGDSWALRNDKSFDADTLRWPVDIVVLPRSEREADNTFEVIADALDANDGVLVQARALTGFVLREQRLLVLRLSACGTNPLGFVCEPDPECLGYECSTCVAAHCAQTPVSTPADLGVFEPPEGLDASSQGLDPDAGTMDGTAPVTDDGNQGDGDGGNGPDADSPGPDADQDSQVPPGCDPGSELSDANACTDIDECARGADDCDDEPQACVNLESGLGFSCACPTGYRGTGRGADGCADIDECTEQTDSCDALTMCNNTAGGYSCGNCPAGYTPGAGGSCQDLDECTMNNGGCDTSPMADCLNQVGAPNTCACPMGYSGNGVGSSGCTDINECLSNNGGCDTSPMATCTNQTGAARTCMCPSGSSGTGVGSSGCVDTPDCMAGSCQHGGRCVEGVNNFSCDCAGTGYSGTTCQIDPCSPNPCGTGINCTRTASATASCAAACASSGGCQPGDSCVTDAECRTGGSSTATCHPTDKVCVDVCGAQTIVSQANLDAARYCKEITGDLILQPNFATLPATALPYLTRVRGDVKGGSGSGTSAAVSITLGRLETIDGGFGLGGFTGLNLVSVPRLTTAGSFEFILSSMERISAPQLTRVNGAFSLGVLQNLTQVDIGNLNSIGGQLQLNTLCRLPWSQVERISTFGTSRNIIYVGCCIMFSQHTSCASGNPPCSCGS
jgi:hypothetical protein